MTQDTDQYQGLPLRYSEISHSINLACARYHREREDVNLLTVSKGHSADAIKQLYALGQRQFGESYLNESQDKQQQLSSLDICWHFIGRIQSNKTANIARDFAWVHSVDRLKIAKRLNDQRPSEKPALNIFLQVNIDEETSKAGIKREELFELAHAIIELPKIKLRGLMALPQRHEDFDRQRQSFARLRELQEQTRDNLTIDKTDTLCLDCLSMGMSNDFEAAIAEQSTHLRIGSALFGPRNT